jgi:hypothetical protein
LLGRENHANDGHVTGASRRRDVTVPGVSLGVRRYGVPGQYPVEPGDRRIGWVDDRHANRYPAAPVEADVQPVHLLAMRRSAGKNQVGVPVRIGISQVQTSRSKYRAPRHLDRQTSVL